MQSLFDLHRRGEPMGGLLGGYTPSNEIVDRATMLPIGQYEDGSLTFAWPGFLKDAYEGAVRSYEQGRQLPRADDSGHYAGTPRAEPLDAFNAASIAPMAGVGMRAAGMAAGPTRDAFMAENLMRQFPDEKAISGGNPLGNNWFGVGGESYWDSSKGLSKLHELPRASRTNGMSWDPAAPPQNDLAGPMTGYDLTALNQAWRNKVRSTGEFFANQPEAGLPALVGQAQEGSQLANADPAYDANALVAERWRDKPRIQGEPSSYGFGYIEPPSVFQQERIDPPSMWFKPQPLPPPPLFR